MEKQLTALVVDDEPSVSEFVAHVLRSDGWHVFEAHSARQAFEMLGEREWTMVFCDVVLGDLNGYEVLRRFAEEQAQARFVLMTGYGSAAGALDATATGAYDYLVKPFTVDQILSISKSVREQNQTPSIPRPNEESLAYTSDLPLIGRSPKFVECLKMVGRVAPTNLPVLITGESGTGKEIIARAIHRRSRRSENAFIAVNCGAIPFELIESELFGHARGSFTGAERERIGLWEEADGGTILLDEITETSSLFQVKLLRALQESEIRRVGSNRTVKVDVRIIAATNRDLEEELNAGRFRQDLMYRLNAVSIHLPPLRERVEDIPLLAEFFAARIRPASLPPVVFSPAAMNILCAYHWSGNVRELENAVLRAASLCDGVIYPEHLPAQMRDFQPNASARTETAEAAKASFSVSPDETGEWLPLAELEAQYANHVLAQTGGNKQAAARTLCVDRKTLNRILHRIPAKQSISENPPADSSESEKI